MKIISIVLTCFFVLSCSSTKVHLYSRYLVAADIKAISSNLKDHDFDVIVNTLDFPSDIQQSTLLYSPFIQGENRLNVLIDILDKSGWVISNVQPLFSGNHYYTQDSVGLLLLPDGVMQSDQIATQVLVNKYRSQGCGMDVELSLRKDGRYLLKYPEKKLSQTDHLKGQWKVTSYPYVELSSDNKEWYFYFEMQKKTEVDVVGKITITELKPVERYYLMPNCAFVYGVR